MISALTALHVMICVGLIIVVLLQTGRGTGMASVFGGGGGGTLMGGKGFGGVLARATAALAILFMLTSITLSLMPKRAGQPESVLGGGTPAQSGQQVPSQTSPPQGVPEQGPTETPSGQ
jgi:preprotein translocase subunit SecG